MLLRIDNTDWQWKVRTCDDDIQHDKLCVSDLWKLLRGCSRIQLRFWGTLQQSRKSIWQVTNQFGLTMETGRQSAPLEKGWKIQEVPALWKQKNGNLRTHIYTVRETAPDTELMLIVHKFDSFWLVLHSLSSLEFWQPFREVANRGK